MFFGKICKKEKIKEVITTMAEATNSI